MGKGGGKGARQPGAVIRQNGGTVVGAPGNANVHITFTSNAREKSVLETFILAFALGLFGAHHFYLGRVGFGVVYFFTFGLLGVGYVVDLFRVPCLVADVNRKLRDPSIAQEKSAMDAYILWFPLGLLGFHHYYLRNYGLGLLYTFTFGIFGIGWLIDAVRIPFMVDSINNRVHNNDPTLNLKNSFDGYLFVLSPLGILGGHHYYLNRPIWGVLYTFTFGLCGVGWVFDWFRIPCLVNRANLRLQPLMTTQPQIDDGDKKYLDDAYILLFPFGFTGLHHFYLRRYGWGALYFCTFGVLGIGYLIDYCRLPCLVSEYNRSRDENRRLATNFLSSQPPGGGAVISVTSTSVMPTGGFTGAVMQPPPQVWQPGAYQAYPPQQYPGAPGYTAPKTTGAGANAPPQPPSYIEAMGSGHPAYQTTIPHQPQTPGYPQTAPAPAPAPPAYGSTEQAGPIPPKNQ